MEITDIEKKLKILIARYSPIAINDADITEESDLINNLGFDSISIMQFLFGVEKEFNIEVSDENLTLEIIGKYSELKKLIVNSVK